MKHWCMNWYMHLEHWTVEQNVQDIVTYTLLKDCDLWAQITYKCGVGDLISMCPHTYT